MSHRERQKFIAGGRKAPALRRCDCRRAKGPIACVYALVKRADGAAMTRASSAPQRCGHWHWHGPVASTAQCSPCSSCARRWHCRWHWHGPVTSTAKYSQCRSCTRRWHCQPQHRRAAPSSRSLSKPQHRRAAPPSRRLSKPRPRHRHSSGTVTPAPVVRIHVCSAAVSFTSAALTGHQNRGPGTAAARPVVLIHICSATVSFTSAALTGRQNRGPGTGTEWSPLGGGRLPHLPRCACSSESESASPR